MATAVLPSLLGPSAFSSTSKRINVVALSTDEYSRWVQTRSTWPRLLTSALYQQLDPLVQELDHKHSKGSKEPKWCKAWTRLHNAVDEEEWEKLKWVQQCDISRLQELQAQSWMSLDVVSGRNVKEQDEIYARIHERYRDCLVLGYLWDRYCQFEGKRGVHDTVAVLQRLQPFDEEETPTFEEREKEARRRERYY